MIIRSKEVTMMSMKNPNLQRLTDELQKNLFPYDRDGVHCICCGKRAIERCYSDAGRREFHISGLCEPCFDALLYE